MWWFGLNTEYMILFEFIMILFVIWTKKYVLWNAGICPIAEIMRNTTFDDHIKTHDRC